MATTKRRGGAYRTPNGGTSYRRGGTVHYQPGSASPRGFVGRAGGVTEAGLAGLLGLVVYGLAEVFLMTAVAILVGLVSALVSFITAQAWKSTERGRSGSTRRRRRGPLHRRAAKYAAQKTRLRVARWRRDRAARRAQRRRDVVTAQRTEQAVIRDRVNRRMAAEEAAAKPKPPVAKPRAPRKRAKPVARPN